MVDNIWSQATVKMQPESIPPSAQMTTIPVFDDHNDMVKIARDGFIPGLPLGELVSGNKKDVIISNLIYTTPAPARVVIYGWHYPSGSNIQPKYAGHINTYADYSHGIRLIQNQAIVDGSSMLCSDILMSSSLHTLLSDEGALSMPYYPDTITTTPIVTVPEIPKSFCIINEDNTSSRILISNDPNVDQYLLYESLDGINFSGPVTFLSNNYVIQNNTSGVINYFKIKASNSAGNSNESEVLAIIPSAIQSEVLLVNAFDRSTVGNTRNFVIQHGKAIENYGLNFSSATNEAYLDGLLNLNDYSIVDYILGEESTVDETYSASEQVLIKSFLDQGGFLFTSGAEIGWDLDNLGNTSDIDFYHTYLKAEYIDDAPNNESGTHYQFEGVTTTPFSDVTIANFDNGTFGTYDVQYPDVINAINGSDNGYAYSNLSNNYAGIYYHGQFPNAVSDSGKIVYLGFPFETIYPESKRFEVMSSVLDYFLIEDNSSFIGENQFTNAYVYPNPFNSNISIQNDANEGVFEVLDTKGQVVKKGTLDFNVTTVNTQNLSPGIYVLKIKNQNDQIVLKMIKK